MALKKMLGFCGVTVAATVGTVWAQSDVPPAERHWAEREVHQFSPPKIKVEMMTRELGLDAYQQAQILKMLEDNLSKIREMSEATEPDAATRARQRELSLAMKDAVERGDKAKMREIQAERLEITKKMAEVQLPLMKKMNEMQTELETQIVGVLHEYQKEKFKDLWSEQLSRGPGSFTRRDARTLRNFVFKLKDLNSSQRQVLEDLFRAYKDKERETRRGGGTTVADDLKKLEEQLYKDVYAALSADQQAEVEKQLQGRRRLERPVAPQTADPAVKPADASAEKDKPANPADPAQPQGQ